jgi:hypothetical protein
LTSSRSIELDPLELREVTSPRVLNFSPTWFSTDTYTTPSAHPVRAPGALADGLW